MANALLRFFIARNGLREMPPRAGRMTDLLTTIYDKLPARLRSIAATFYGYRLRSWRYGPETEQLVDEALSRDEWRPEKWHTWQQQRLAYTLHRAATRVPYYRAYWQRRRRGGDKGSWEYLENWPVLGKQTLREQPEAFVADDCNIKFLYSDQTSGTTGTPLKLWYDKKALHAWHALFEARARRWHGVTRHENWATLGGRQVIPPHVKHPPFWVWNSPMRQLYLSSSHISTENVGFFVDALDRYAVTHMVAYPSIAATLAAEAQRLNRKPASLLVVISIAEPLTDDRRQIIEVGLGCVARETYGMSEIVAEATECRARTLHLWPELGWIEVFSDTEDMEAPLGATGRIICTSLLNEAMPLIRYDVGDRTKRVSEDLSCSCGRTLPIIEAIEGRTNDLLLTEDNRRLYIPLSFVLNGLPIREAQIVQESLNQVRFRYVPADGFTQSAEQLIVERIKSRLVGFRIIIEPVSKIARDRNGKFQAVVRNVKRTDQQAAYNG